MLKKIIPFDSFAFVYKVCLRTFLVGAIVLTFPHIIKIYLLSEPDFLRFMLESAINMLWCCLAVYFLGCNAHEKQFITKGIAAVYRKIRKCLVKRT